MLERCRRIRTYEIEMNRNLSKEPLNELDHYNYYIEYFRTPCAKFFENKIDEVAQIKNSEGPDSIKQYKKTLSEFISKNFFSYSGEYEKSEKNAQRNPFMSAMKSIRKSLGTAPNTLQKETYLADKKRASEIMVEFLSNTRGPQNYGSPKIPLLKILLNFNNDGEILALFDKSVTVTWSGLKDNQKDNILYYLNKYVRDDTYLYQLIRKILTKSPVGGRRTRARRGRKRRSTRRS